MSRARDFVPRLGPDAIGKPEDTRAQIRVTHPFLGWENLGGLEQLHLEATRLRSHEFDGDVEILTLGGSVAEMFGQYGVPRLEERLRADPRFASKRIYWYRYARGGFKQPQQVNMLTWLLGQGFTPDIVVNLDGFNEVALGMDNAKRGRARSTRRSRCGAIWPRDPSRTGTRSTRRRAVAICKCRRRRSPSTR